MIDSHFKESLKGKFDTGTFSPADLPEFFQVFTQLGNQVDELKDEVIGWDRVVEFEIAGSGTYWIAIEDCKFMSGVGSNHDARVRIILTASDAVQIFSGEKDAESALNSGEIKLEGSLPDAIRLYNLIELVLEEIEY